MLSCAQLTRDLFANAKFLVLIFYANRFRRFKHAINQEVASCFGPPRKLTCVQSVQVKVWFQNQRSKMKRLQLTGEDMTKHQSVDNCLISQHRHHHQQQPGVSMATVVKEETKASLATQTDPLTPSPNKSHAVSWRQK